MYFWEDSPTEFITQEEEDSQDNSAGSSSPSSGRSSRGIRAAGLALIRDLCNAFPEKVLSLHIIQCFCCASNNAIISNRNSCCIPTVSSNIHISLSR